MKQQFIGQCRGIRAPQKLGKRVKPYSKEHDYIVLASSLSLFGLSLQKCAIGAGAVFYTLTGSGINPEPVSLSAARKLLGKLWKQWGSK